ncbi:MAG TPA: dihydrofolate reductase family protein [Solirubrobacteraceae bacterium]|jgi:dihydrofolate reductase|nr:dihydrofolate reductase family protein [Solirubrobacteraceae bacterium]
MTQVLASITTSVDGYITGPNDGPGCGLGEGGEQLHYWVFGGPWTYGADAPRGEPLAEDADWFKQTMSRIGAVVGGRTTYEAAEHWGDANPFGVPFFVVTHRPEEEPAGGEFTFVDGVESAVARAAAAAGERAVSIMGGADVIRQALGAGLIDELTIIVAPVVLAAGKRLFDGFVQPLRLETTGIRQSPLATFITYQVPKS